MTVVKSSMHRAEDGAREGSKEAIDSNRGEKYRPLVLGTLEDTLQAALDSGV